MLRFIVFLLLFSFFSSHAQLGKRFKQRQKINNNETVKPDYSNLNNWASHPEKNDFADSIPSFLKDEKRDTLADVFFIHPTTFTKGILTASWNAAMNDQTLNEETDKKTMLMQASIFNGSCRVFAPRYRQAHLKAFFMKNNKAAAKALDLAYEDVKAAFEYYLSHDNNGRPIIIAGHSQGGNHSTRLLKEFFDGKPLQKKLVCAYAVGWAIKKNEFENIPVCNNPAQTGCVVGWRSYRKGTSDKQEKIEAGNSLCVNPITWTTTSTPADKSLHKGMVLRNFNELQRQKISASIEPDHGILWVDIPLAMDESKGKINNLHIADYNLFYMDVRENVRQRTGAFLNKKNQ